MKRVQSAVSRKKLFAFWRALVTLLLVATLVPEGLMTSVEAAANGPILNVQAPSQVEVGQPFTLTLRARNVTDIGGYETAILFHDDAARFAGVWQRENDLAQLGRHVQPLLAAELPGYVAIGLFTCPFENCLAPENNRRRTRGGRGSVKLAEVTFVADKPGVLELRLDAIKFVDIQGNPINVRVRTQEVKVRVGASDTPHPAPPGLWTLPATPAINLASTDLTGDGQTTIADATEVAMEWQTRRIAAAPCGRDVNSIGDVNQDGCVDVSDAQIVAARIGLAVTGSATSSPVTALLDLFSVPAYAGASTQAVTTFTVNMSSDEADANVGNGRCDVNTALSGDQCTLRAALLEANAIAGHQVINFNIPGPGPHTIQLSAGRRLPALSDLDGVTIDGYTQPGASVNTDPLYSNAVIQIQVRGIGAGGADPLDGFRVSGANNTIRGLAIYNFRRPIWLYGEAASNNVVIGNFIGINASGGEGIPQVELVAHGIHAEAGANNTWIGGTALEDRNVISGNGRHGIGFWHEKTDNNRVYNNIIGLAPNGATKAPNRRIGVDFNYGSSENILGGVNPGERNVISGNDDSAIEISHVGSGGNPPMPVYTTNILVQGNYIGVDALGGNTLAPPSVTGNLGYGIFVEDGVIANTIADNVIGNNLRGGIGLDSHPNSPVRLMVIRNNWIGVTPNGTPAPNYNQGILMDALQTQVGPDNVIAYNYGPGIRIEELDADFNTITRNSIYSNQGLGIDLAPASQNGIPNPNDEDDSDSGPNEQLNFPVLTRVTNKIITGVACPGCTVELFIADGPANAYGEGKTYVSTLTADAVTGAFSLADPPVSIGAYITATATDGQGNTSEFSLNAEVVFHNDPPVVQAGGPYTVPEGGSVTVNATGSDPDGDPVEYAWDLDGNGTFETNGQSVTFLAATLDGDAARTITVRGTDPRGASGTATAQVMISNVAPTVASFNNSGPVDEGQPATITFVQPADVPADVAAGLRFAVACDGGSLEGATYANSLAQASHTCLFDDGPASKTVRGRVIDKDGGFSEYTTVVQVNNVNPSVQITGAPSFATPGALITLGSMVNEPSQGDMQAGFIYAWEVARDGVQVATGGMATFSFRPEGLGSFDVTLTVTDRDGGSSSTQLTLVTTNSTNQPPGAATGGPYSVVEGGSVTVTASGSDPEGGALSYAWDLDYDGIFETTGQSAIFSAGEIEGPATRMIRVRVSDSGGLFSIAQTTVSITNAAPTGGALVSNDSVAEGSSVTVSFVDVTDVSGDLAAGLRYALACNGSALEQSTYATSSANPNFICEFDDGPTNVTVRGRAFDKDGAFTEYTAVITVRNVNPTAATISVAATADEGRPVSIAVLNPTDVSSADVDAGLRFAVACNDEPLGGVTYALANPSATLSCTFDDGPGTRMVRLRVIDKDNGFTEYTANVTVRNVPPTEKISGVPSGAPVGETITLISTAIDPSVADTNAGFIYAWTVTRDGQAVATGSGPTLTFQTAAVGTYAVVLVTQDKDGGQATDSVQFEVMDGSNRPPSASAGGPYSVVEGGSITLMGIGNDPENEPLSFAWDLDGNGDYETIGQNATLQASSIDGPGIVNIPLRVTDSGGLSVTVIATVLVANAPPAAASLVAVRPALEGTPVGISFLNPTDPSQADVAATLRFAIACDNSALDGVTYAAASSNATLNCVFPEGPGSYTVRGRVIDKDGGFTEYSQTVTVINANPVATLVTPASVAEGASFSVMLTQATDPSSEDAAAGFRYAFACNGESLAGASYANSSASNSITCVSIDGPGAQTLRARIIDRDNGFSEYTASVMITNSPPTATLTVPPQGVEGDQVTVALQGTVDPSSEDTAAGFRYAFACSGESLAGATYANSQSSNSTSCTLVDGPGNQVVRARVIDHNDGFTEYEAVITVTNANPIANLIRPLSVVEGDTFTLALEEANDLSSADLAAGLRYSFSCNGNPLAGVVYASAGSVPATTCSLDDGPSTRTVRARVIDKDNGFTEYVATIEVRNANPSAALVAPSSVVEGGSFTVNLINASDVSSADRTATFRYAFACNNESLTHITYQNGSSGSSFTCSAGDGPTTRTVRARVIDKDGGVSEYTAMVTIINGAPMAMVSNNGPVAEGSPLTITFTNQADPSDADLAAGLRYAVACDGGSLVDVSYATASTSPTQTCIFDDGPDTRSIRVRVIDKDNGFTEYATNASITNVAPTARLEIPAVVTAGSAIEVELAQPFDPSSADRASLSFAFDCNGGTPAAFGPLTTISCATSEPGTQRVTAIVRDKDGDQSVYSALVHVQSNLLLNPGFELDANSDAQPDNWSSSRNFTRAGGGRSGFAGRFAASNDATFSVSQQVSGLAANTYYTVGSWLNIPASSDPNGFAIAYQIRWMNGASVIRTTTLGTFTGATDGWVDATFTVLAPANTTGARLILSITSLSSEILVDDAVFFLGNQLVNGNFEAANSAGQPAQWSPNSRFLRSDALVRSSSFAGQHFSTDNASYNVSQLVQRVTPNARYTVTGWINIPPTTDTFTFRVRVRWLDANGLALGNPVNVQVFQAPTQGWEQAAAVLTAPSAARGARVELSVVSLGSAIYNDDFAFIPDR